MPKVFAYVNKETGQISGYGSSFAPGTLEFEIPENHEFLLNPGLFYVNKNGAIERSLDAEKRVAETVLRRRQIEFLMETDWMITRHRDQVELGVPTRMTDEEYKDLLLRRDKAREGTLTFD